MNEHANPPRLSQVSAHGAILRRARDYEMSPERLQRGAEAVRARLGGADAAAASATGGAVGTKIAVALVAVAIAGASAWVVGRGAESEAPRAAVPVVAVDAGSAVPAAETDAAVITPSATELAPGAAEPAPEVVPEPPSAREAATARSRRAPAPQPEPSADAPASTLLAEVEAMDRAHKFATGGAYGRAAAEIRSLLAAHPDTALRADAELALADYLARGGRTQQAIAQFEKLADDPRHEARWSEIHLVLGDLWRQQQRCDRAANHYRRVIELGQRADNTRRARRGLERCRDAQKNAAPIEAGAPGRTRSDDDPAR